MLSGKNILIGISGGIAAYKTPFLIRELIKKGCQVKVVVTKNALEFVTLTTLKTLSQNDVYHDMFLHNEYSTEHISLTDWADCFVVAPATANIIGKYVNGIADCPLSTSLLAFNKDVFIAPAMNSKMFSNPILQKNIQTLKSIGISFISSTKGYLACGYEGEGRMEEPIEIVRFMEEFYSKKLELKGKTVLVTAGGTQEQIDAVRYIGNNSSGKMGFCIAEELANRGAKVILITGRTHLEVKNNNITLVNVISSHEMFIQTTKHFPKSDVAILSAAVSDYRPEQQAKNKIKKTQANLTITLTPTEDILATLGKTKKKNQILVGFALETDNELENAKKKLTKKNLDFIVLNSLNDKGAGFGTSTNKITIIDKNNKIEHFKLKSKEEVAVDIVNKLISL
ncbi:MAG: bifunctional phosphopantothenoylcysteine decarboxylase/phosphopantothenate--cysteine ligase CoaBC [Bacteroidales bacterium]|jgi:phosphopantothenoylcysteine decarboxylase/phosphopantothenate--cysteine ligase|nr:bifunctional phosphopantothenoylcysteine decarboxylase/phosphopantothenate--cysteine ligase CoaBC [Bacteroidales bacterium]MDX9798896.1 bifunctional phosphopantothenoylcysteine decarboxylase/phosphopantothenate--cysteine ligase CoaBC [Bacteroidales bacterium]